ESLPRISVPKQKSTLDIARVTNSDKESQKYVSLASDIANSDSESQEYIYHLHQVLYDNNLLDKQKISTNKIK
ncbi:21486_t:CDS:2, partial [Rhizophagus irregularis]